MAALMLAATGPAALAAGPPAGDFAKRALAAHNRARDAMGVPRLRWSKALAADAQGWAAHLGAIGYLAHAQEDPRAADPQGENLWAGTRASYTVEQMIAYWTEEGKHFRNGRFPDNSTTGELEDIGHYTQIIWRKTTSVGCAIADNGRDEYLVCRYRASGNVIGEHPL